jgi:hypothetical protein
LKRDADVRNVHIEYKAVNEPGSDPAARGYQLSGGDRCGDMQAPK